MELDKTVRYRPYTPTERWVSGLNQQFTKLPIQKVREFESHSFRKCPYGGIGIRSGLRSHTIIGSNPITGTNVLFFDFIKSPKIFLRVIFWYIGKIVVYLIYKVDWETK